MLTPFQRGSYCAGAGAAGALVPGTAGAGAAGALVSGAGAAGAAGALVAMASGGGVAVSCFWQPVSSPTQTTLKIATNNGSFFMFAQKTLNLRPQQV